MLRSIIISVFLICALVACGGSSPNKKQSEYQKQWEYCSTDEADLQFGSKDKCQVGVVFKMNMRMMEIDRQIPDHIWAMLEKDSKKKEQYIKLLSALKKCDSDVACQKDELESILEFYQSLPEYPWVSKPAPGEEASRPEADASTTEATRQAVDSSASSFTSPEVTNVYDESAKQENVVSEESPTQTLSNLPKADRPSFDCTKVSNTIESMICSSTLLMAADAELGRLYPKLNRKSGGVLKNSQLQWLKRRNRCTDVECIEQMYASRLIELRSSPEKSE